MSDTDDTDLLLLIPPDFFLVRSDLEDLDSDFDFGFEPKDIKDSIVSDLITQVNDLESRICLIESIERTSTRCSTCNDDSFINQSVTSLTESDALRAQVKEQRVISKQQELSDSYLMVNSPNTHVLPGLTSKLEDGVRKSGSSLVAQNIVDKSIEYKLNDADIEDTEKGRRLNLNTVSPGQIPKGDIQNKPLSAQSQLSREKQTQLLNEVDTFLLSKQLNTVESDSDNTHQRIDRGKPGEEFVNTAVNNGIRADQVTCSPKDGELEVKDEEYIQSLALSEVYKLISEMEETQTEMQKKLNINSFKPSLHQQDRSRSNAKEEMNRHMTSLGQVLDLEDLSIKSPNPLYGKQAGDGIEQFRNEKNHICLENLDDFRFARNGETNYNLPTQLPLSNERKSNQRTSKTLSPSRATAGSQNPISIMRANLPGRQDTRSTQFDDETHSPRKSSGFRRQLQFEKQVSPLRVSRSKTSLHGEQRSLHVNEYQSKNEDDRFVVPTLRITRPLKTNQSLEEKFNSLTMQRASGSNSKESQNTSNKPVSDNLHQKLSSNNLLSLSELWNKEPTFYSDDPNKLRQKLEEERYRRQHCEQEIQTLQLRVLEEQEKLAVAIRVDQEKDRAIMQITESWKKLNDHWGELEEQRHNLAVQLQTEKESFKRRDDEMMKKVERWEKEVSQALDLAAGYKEKSETIQKQMESLKRSTDEKLLEAENQHQVMSEENKKLSAENQNLTEQLTLLQKRLKEEEDLLTKLKAELEKSRKKIEEFEAENSVLNEQKSSLTTGIKEERNRISILEQKLNTLQQALNEACKKERAAQEEMRVSQERVEVARTELRALYQGQLEAVVKEKLQEFQAQLEAAETALKAELQAKEKQWADKANEHYRQLHDKYKRDLLRVEQIHKADVNSWREKLVESERLRAAVEKRLQEEGERRADIAQRLHSVMETQWREALNIISNPVKAMYETPKDEAPVVWSEQQGQNPERLQGHGEVAASRSNSATSLGPGDEAPFCRDGVVTYRTSQPTHDQQLKTYIQMLLERGPGNPVAPANTYTQADPEQETFLSGSNDLLNKWIMENEKKMTGQTDKQNQFNKPPWR